MQRRSACSLARTRVRVGLHADEDWVGWANVGAVPAGLLWPGGTAPVATRATGAATRFHAVVDARSFAAMYPNTRPCPMVAPAPGYRVPNAFAAVFPIA